MVSSALGKLHRLLPLPEALRAPCKWFIHEHVPPSFQLKRHTSRNSSQMLQIDHDHMLQALLILCSSSLYLAKFIIIDKFVIIYLVSVFCIVGRRPFFCFPLHLLCFPQPMGSSRHSVHTLYHWMQIRILWYHTHYLSLIPSKTSCLQPVFDCLVPTLGYMIVFVGVQSLGSSLNLRPRFLGVLFSCQLFLVFVLG